MNSLILTSLAAFGRYIVNCFKNSVTSKLLMKIFNGFSEGWKNSSILHLIGSTDKADYADKSIIYRFFNLPVTFWEFMQKKIGTAINEKIKSSFICNLGKVYVNSFMAVNTKFWGALLLSSSIIYTLIKALTVHSYSKPVLAVGAIGAIMLILNFNLMAFMNGSKVVDFIKKAVAFPDLDFEFYDEGQIRGVSKIALALLTGFLTGAVMAFMPLYGLAVPFAIFGMLLVMYAPVTGVYAAVFLAPIVPTMMLAGICIWTGISFLIYALSHTGFKFRLDGVGLGMLVLLTLLFISSVFSFAIFGSLKVWAMYFVFMMFYFVIVNTVNTKEQLFGLLKVFVFSGTLVALYGVMQYVFGWTTSNAWIDEEMFEDDIMRVYSTLANPNVLGEYLLLVLPVCAVFFLKNKINTWAKWVYLAMFAVLALCLVLTQSRGCWIGFMLGAVIFITFYEGKLWGIIPLLLCLLPFIVPETIVNRLLSVGNMEDSSTSYRVYIWLGTLGMLKHYWLGGIGMGESAFAKIYPFFSYNAIVAPHSHNTFLQLTVEAGVGALLVFLFINFLFVKKSVKTFRLGKTKKNIYSVSALALASGVIGFLAQSMFDYTFYNYRVMALFFMVLAMGTALLNIKSNNS